MFHVPQHLKTPGCKLHYNLQRATGRKGGSETLITFTLFLKEKTWLSNQPSSTTSSIQPCKWGLKIHVNDGRWYNSSSRLFKAFAVLSSVGSVRLNLRRSCHQDWRAGFVDLTWLNPDRRFYCAPTVQIPGWTDSLRTRLHGLVGRKQVPK